MGLLIDMFTVKKIIKRKEKGELKEQTVADVETRKKKYDEIMKDRKLEEEMKKLNI